MSFLRFPSCCPRGPLSPLLYIYPLIKLVLLWWLGPFWPQNVPLFFKRKRNFTNYIFLFLLKKCVVCVFVPWPQNPPIFLFFSPSNFLVNKSFDIYTHTERETESQSTVGFVSVGCRKDNTREEKRFEEIGERKIIFFQVLLFSRFFFPSGKWARASFGTRR